MIDITLGKNISILIEKAISFSYQDLTSVKHLICFCLIESSHAISVTDVGTPTGSEKSGNLQSRLGQRKPKAAGPQTTRSGSSLKKYYNDQVKIIFSSIIKS